MSWSTWPLLRKTVSQPTERKRKGRHQQGLQLRNRQGIGWSQALPQSNLPGRWVARPPQQARFN
jgi:hypothetical protein